MKKKLLFTLIPALAVLLAVFSCEKQMIRTEAGAPLDKGSLDDEPYLYVKTDAAAGKSVDIGLTYGEGEKPVRFSVISSVPLALSEKITFSVDQKAMEEHLAGTDYKELPSSFYEFVDGSVALLKAGESVVGKELKIYSRNPIGNSLAPGKYILPVTVSSSLSGFENPTILIGVTVRERYTDPDGYKVYENEDCFTVFYINTSMFDPRLALDQIYIKRDKETEKDEHLGYGNIIVLRSTAVNYDASEGKVTLKPSSDMRHVIDHYQEMVLPLQETGRKVLFCIDGGGRGVGFCNFTDVQIADFVRQVKLMVETYGFDGVNLWDRNSGYDRPDAPQTNTTSYPKLIRALREALGQDRLITLTDYKEPTAYFHDTEATGGIAVGEYIDYAWSGYVDSNEPVQVVDPWHQGESCVSSLYPRKPIAGLSPEKYGCIHCTWYRAIGAARVDLVEEWRRKGFRNNGMTVYYDIRSTLQDELESSSAAYPVYMLNVLYPMSTFITDINRLNNADSPTGYGKWLKTW